MTQERRAALGLIKDLLSKSSQLVIMNERDPLILDTSTREIGGVLMQIQTLCFCLLCEDSCSLLVGQAFYGPNGPSQPCIPCKFLSSKIGDPLRVSISRAHPWSSKRMSWPIDSQEYVD